MYDYVIIYVDDLFVAMCDPQHFFDELQVPLWNYKLKGVIEPCYHLGLIFSMIQMGPSALEHKHMLNICSQITKPCSKNFHGPCFQPSAKTTTQNLSLPLFVVLMILPTTSP